MKVCNITSRKGNTIPNQFIITDDEGNEFFLSYDSVIAKIPHKRCFNCIYNNVCEEKDNPNDCGKILLDEKYWNYSATTGKYRNIFLNEGIAETRNKIKSGEYILTNLNELNN